LALVLLTFFHPGIRGRADDLDGELAPVDASADDDIFVKDERGR